MYPELNLRLTKIIEQKRLKTKLEQQLGVTESELKEKSANLETLRRQLEKEKVDVEKLERTGLTSLFYSVLGSHEQQLEKERQELLSAQLRYQQTKQQVDYLEQDRQSLRQQLSGLQNVESDYRALLGEKEQFLQHSDQPAARELIAIAEQIANCNADIKEIREAIQAGNNVLSELDPVIRSLESARGWGTWDLLGGGMLSTAIKHSEIDDARQGIHAVQIKLSQFKKELADVQKSVDLEINISGFETFADFFFDGLIFDWVVQSKIVDSLERVMDTQGTIRGIVHRLGKMNQAAQKKASDLQQQRIAIIERS